MSETVAQRILLLEGDLLPGCAACLTARLACFIKNQGREVFVACRGGTGCRNLEGLGIPHVICPSFRLPWFFWHRWHGFARLLKFQPQLIHAQHHTLSRAARVMARRLQCPYVLSVGEQVDSARALSLDRKLLRLILSVSEDVREDLVNQAKVPKEIIRVVPHGVDVVNYQRFQPAIGGKVAVGTPVNAGASGNGARTAAGTRQASRVIGTIVPLLRNKGLDVFLRAAREVLEHKKDVHFLVAGRGPEGERLRALAASLGLDGSITFVDYVEDHAQLLQAMDLFVLPAVQEGSGLAALEAMACGRPVIASGVGGLYSIVRDRVTGLLVPSRDVSSLRNAIIELLDNPSLAEKLRSQALVMVQNEFNQDVLFRKTLAVYEEALEDNRNGKASRF